MRSDATQTRTLCPPAVVAERYGVSTSTIWRWVAKGILPEPIRITRSTVGWWSDLLESLEREHFTGPPSCELTDHREARTAKDDHPPRDAALPGAATCSTTDP